MALTKLPKRGLADNSVDTSKIEDGTIQNLEFEDATITAAKLSSTIDLSSKTVTFPDTSVTNDQLAGSIANDKLTNSSITFQGSSVSLGGSTSAILNTDWQSVITADGSTQTTLVAGRGYLIDTTSAEHTVLLPSSPSLGDFVEIKDYAGTFGTNKLTINANGGKIAGSTVNNQLTNNRAAAVLTYVDSTQGWLYTVQNNAALLTEPNFTSATGGTVTTSGDFKIHSFTSSGCFAVSSLGNSPTVPTGGPSNVDYLVVAGGGGGGRADGGGGGGAGGYRTTFPSPGCNAGAFPISAITYPITVGAGGSAPHGQGNDSIFSTITSAGGGKGGVAYSVNGGPGGSGGGGGGPNGPAGPSGGTPGSGNTPPVSPPQGNNGGVGSLPSGILGGGGGGASANGGNNAGNGGNGSPNSITGSAVTYAGGGGGAGDSRPGATGGSGGSGGGGPAGGNGSPAGTAGTSNTGGGGGAAGYCGSGSPVRADAGAGGSGIVIIRYKYQ